MYSRFFPYSAVSKYRTRIEEVEHRRVSRHVTITLKIGGMQTRRKPGLQDKVCGQNGKRPNEVFIRPPPVSRVRREERRKQHTESAGPREKSFSTSHTTLRYIGFRSLGFIPEISNSTQWQKHRVTRPRRLGRRRRPLSSILIGRPPPLALRPAPYPPSIPPTRPTITFEH